MVVPEGTSVWRDARIEHTHKREVIKTADWIFDLGPEGRDKGGEVVAEGMPDEAAEELRSYTGSYLQPLLQRPRMEVIPNVARQKGASAVAIPEREEAQ